MSEATKLKNLLNKAKPSIQFEVRKKKPTSTAQFLEYAKEAEELMQLSNMFIGNPNSNNNTQLVKHNSIPSLVSNLSAPMNQSFDNALNNFLPTYTRNFDHKSRFSNNLNTYSSPKSLPSSYSQLPQNRFRFNNNNSSRNTQHGPSYNYTSNQRKKYQQPRTNTSNNTYSRQRTANTVNIPYRVPDTVPVSESCSSTVCSRCNQPGHQAAACPNF